jgi:hypothetical protein
MSWRHAVQNNDVSKAVFASVFMWKVINCMCFVVSFRLILKIKKKSLLARRQYICALRGSQNELPLFPYSPLTD